MDQFAIDGCGSLLAVEKTDQGVGFADGLKGLLPDFFIERIFGPRNQAPRVDQKKRAAAPVGVGIVAVARDAGLVIDQRLIAADEPVEKARLADIGPADDGDDG